MQVEIYADMVFIINLIMDFFIFWIVSKLLKRNTKLWRVFLGSFVTALLYCIIVLIPSLRILYNLPAAFFILMLGIYVAFYPKTLKEFVKMVFFAHISAFAVGGLGMALFYYTSLPNLMGNFIGINIENFSYKVLLVSICLAYITIKLSIRFIKRIVIKKQSIHTIKIYYHDGDLCINTLLDTGNSLKDPLSEMPVIIAEFDAVKVFLPDSLKLLFYENKENNLAEIIANIGDNEIVNRIRMIPFNSVGKQNGMLIGFKPDKVEVFNTDKTIAVKNVIIGIYNYSLSKDGAYQGLLNPELLEA